MEIRTADDDIIIIDAGTGIRRLGNLMLKEKRLHYHFLFTHGHWDHLMGFPFFKPLFLKQAQLIMHRCPFKSKFVETVLSKVMAPPNFPIRFTDITASVTYTQACPQPFTIGSVTVTPIPISHPNAGSGYKFTEADKSFVFLTDNELGYIHPMGLARKDYLKFVKGADLLIHDAEYTPEEYRTTRTWGHSCYTDTLALATEAGVKRLGLFHLNQDRTDQQMDDVVAKCRHAGAAKGTNPDVFGVATGMTFKL